MHNFGMKNKIERFFWTTVYLMKLLSLFLKKHKELFEKILLLIEIFFELNYYVKAALSFFHNCSCP